MKEKSSRRLLRAIVALSWGAVWFLLFFLMGRLSVAAVPKAYQPLLTAVLMFPVVLLLPPSLLPEDLAALPRGERTARYLSLGNPSPTVCALAFLCGTGFCLLTSSLVSLLPIPAEMTDAYQNASADITGKSTASLLSLVLFSPLLEELTFRGLMLNSFRRGLPAWAALLLSSALFALCHVDTLWIAYAFFNGLMLGILLLLTRSLVSSFLFHIAFNLTGSAEGLLFPSPDRITLLLLLAAGLLLSAGTLWGLLRAGREKRKEKNVF